MISTAFYLPNKFSERSIIPGLFKISCYQTHKIKVQNVHFYLSSIQLYQLFHLGQTIQTLNTLLTSINFNNPIWISTLCTWQSKTDAPDATKIIWNNPPSCNEHSLKIPIKSSFPPCEHHPRRQQCSSPFAL